jgi:hypothetical protein
MADNNIRRWSRINQVAKAVTAFKRIGKIGEIPAEQEQEEQQIPQSQVVLRTATIRTPFNYIDYLGVPDPWAIIPINNNNRVVDSFHFTNETNSGRNRRLWLSSSEDKF